jgi:DNA invertase Pin-like site-specific DNA recombinase
MPSSSASAGSSGGRIPGSLAASIDLPAPGGPVISLLWSINRLLGEFGYRTRVTVNFAPGTLYDSYIRFSRLEQLKGDSLERQQEGERWAAELGLTLNENLRDLGLSAYHGTHREKGDLGTYLRMVEKGEIPRGRVLMVEDFDRLSRERVLDALMQFLALIHAGIVVATSIDRQIYSLEIINNDWTKLIHSLSKMSRAHDESAMKAGRVATAWEHKRRDATTKPMTARCPEWLRLTDGKFKKIYERVAIVERIFEECVSGLGNRKIATRLDAEGISAFRGMNGWHESSVQKILSNEAVLGIFQPHRKIKGKRVPVGEPIPDYYPEIIDETLFWRARSAARARQTGAAGRKGKTYSNLFSGFSYCDCGSSLVYVNKGSGPKGGQYLVCSSGKRKLCTNNVHYPYQSLEDNILRHIPLIDFANVLPEKPKEADNGIGELEAKLSRQTQRLDSLFKFDDLESAQPHIRALDEEIKSLKVQLTEARKTAKMTEHMQPDRLDQLLEMIARLHFADENQLYVLRAGLAQELRRIIDRVVLNQDREIRVVLKPAAGYGAQMEFRNGRLDQLRLTHLDTGETTEIPRILFLEMQRYMLSQIPR